MSDNQGAYILRDAAKDALAFSQDRSKKILPRIALRVASKWLLARADHFSAVTCNECGQSVALSPASWPKCLACAVMGRGSVVCTAPTDAREAARQTAREMTWRSVDG